MLLGTLFVWRQTRLADPMMPVDVFRRPIFALSISSATCTFTAQGLAFVSLPFFFHTVLGKSATDTGILLTAWPLALAGIAPIAGRLADRHHAGVLGAIGLTSMTTGLVLTALLPRQSLDGRHHVAAGAVRRGLRHLRRAQQPADDECRAARRSGSAGGIIATARTLGQTMGAALVALMFGLFDFSGGGSEAATASQAAIWLGAAFAATALVIGSMRMRLQR